MKSELRIGNLLTVGNYDVKVIEVHHLGVQVCDLEETQDTWELYTDRIKPIPLTEEWLDKFGFEKDFEDDYMMSFQGRVYYYSNGFLMKDFGDKTKLNQVKINHLHQLQNLFFALTGEELTLKSE